MRFLLTTVGLLTLFTGPGFAGLGVWSPLRPPVTSVYCFAAAKTDSAVIYLSGRLVISAWGAKDRFVRSTDGGQSWNVLGETADYPVSKSYLIEVDPRSAGTVYASVRSKGLYKSTDYGSTWQQVFWIAASNYEVISMNVDWQDSRILYIYSHSDGLCKSTDGGSSWKTLRTDMGGSYYMVMDPADHRVLYVGHYSSISKTTNGGQSWQELTEGLPSFVDLHQLSICPVNPNLLFDVVATNWGTISDLYRSENGGATWAKVDLSAAKVEWASYDPIDGTLLCRFDGQLQASTDGGASWRNLTRTPNWRRMIAICQTRPYTLYGASINDSNALGVLNYACPEADADGDGTVSGGDLVVYCQVVSENLNDTGLADLTGDGHIKADDLAILKLFLVNTGP